MAMASCPRCSSPTMQRGFPRGKSSWWPFASFLWGFLPYWQAASQPFASTAATHGKADRLSRREPQPHLMLGQPTVQTG